MKHQRPLAPLLTSLTVALGMLGCQLERPSEDYQPYDEQSSPYDRGEESDNYDPHEDSGHATEHGAEEYDHETDHDDSTAVDGEATPKRRCSTQDQDPQQRNENLERVAHRLDSLREARRRGSVDNTVEIPIYFHVINSQPGLTHATQSQLRSQVNVLNKSFSGRSRRNNKAAGRSGFQFRLAGTTHTTNAHWNDDCGSQRTNLELLDRLRVGGADTLNVVICSLDALGKAYYPTIVEINPIMDGIRIHPQTLPNNKWNRRLRPADRLHGDTLVHEVGHWLGLPHTFQGVARDDEGVLGCNEGPGDGIDDTPFHAVNYICKAADTCPGGGTDPIHNFMNYTLDPCLTEFSDGQIELMQATWLEYRASDPHSAPDNPDGEDDEPDEDDPIVAPSTPPMGSLNKPKRSYVTGVAFDPDLGQRPVTVRVLVDGEAVATGVADRRMARSPRGHREVGRHHKFRISMPRLPNGRHTITVAVPDYDGRGDIIDNEGILLGPKTVRFRRN